MAFEHSRDYTQTYNAFDNRTPGEFGTFQISTQIPTIQRKSTPHQTTTGLILERNEGRFEVDITPKMGGDLLQISNLSDEKYFDGCVYPLPREQHRSGVNFTF